MKTNRFTTSAGISWLFTLKYMWISKFPNQLANQSANYPTNYWTKNQTNDCVNAVRIKNYVKKQNKSKNKQINEQTDRSATDRPTETDRQRQTHRRTDRQTDRQRQIHKTNWINRSFKMSQKRSKKAIPAIPLWEYDGIWGLPEGGKVPYLLSSRSFYKGPNVLSTASQELFRVLRMELFKDCYHSHNKWRTVDLIGWTSCYHCTWRKRTCINRLRCVGTGENQTSNDGENTSVRIGEALGSLPYIAHCIIMMWNFSQYSRVYADRWIGQ